MAIAASSWSKPNQLNGQGNCQYPAPSKEFKKNLFHAARKLQSFSRRFRLSLFLLAAVLPEVTCGVAFFLHRRWSLSSTQLMLRAEELNG